MFEIKVSVEYGLSPHASLVKKWIVNNELLHYKSKPLKSSVKGGTRIHSY